MLLKFRVQASACSLVAESDTCGYASHMATIVEIEKLALTLPEKQRAILAANLLDSLHGVLTDDDEGIAEALRRDADLEANPTQAISLVELDDQIKSRRG